MQQQHLQDQDQLEDESENQPLPKDHHHENAARVRETGTCSFWGSRCLSDPEMVTGGTFRGDDENEGVGTEGSEPVLYNFYSGEGAYENHLESMYWLVKRTYIVIWDSIYSDDRTICQNQPTDVLSRRGKPVVPHWYPNVRKPQYPVTVSAVLLLLPPSSGKRLMETTSGSSVPVNIRLCNTDNTIPACNR
ncbi:hypothetical protein QTP88_027740 [Uroleucon formosanum]